MNEKTQKAEPETQAAAGAAEPERLKQWLEAALLAAGQPLTLNQLNALFPEGEQPGHGPIREALALLDAELSGRAVELVEVAGGYRLQIRSKLMPVVSNLWAEKPPKYSRALLETLAIVAYRQPITRGEIEQIRGVSLSANILKTLQEREWIKVVGHRDIPGKPELLGTTKAFLDYFGLKGLDDLPTLAEIRDIDNIEPELELNDPEPKQAAKDDQLAQDAIGEEAGSPVESRADFEPEQEQEPPFPDEHETEETGRRGVEEQALESGEGRARHEGFEDAGAEDATEAGHQDGTEDEGRERLEGRPGPDEP